MNSAVSTFFLPARISGAGMRPRWRRCSEPGGGASDGPFDVARRKRCSVRFGRDEAADATRRIAARPLVLPRPCRRQHAGSYGLLSRRGRCVQSVSRHLDADGGLRSPTAGASVRESLRARAVDHLGGDGGRTRRRELAEATGISRRCATISKSSRYGKAHHVAHFRRRVSSSRTRRQYLFRPP